MAFFDNTYSGKYYRYITMTSEVVPAARVRLQHLYFYNFITASLITTVIFILLSVIAGRLNTEKCTGLMNLFKIWHTLAPSAAIIIFSSFAFATFMRIKRLKNIEFVKHAICSLPWVIGCVQGGLLMVNLDIEMNCDPKAAAMAQLASIQDIVNGQKTLKILLQGGPLKKLRLEKYIKSDAEAYYILAVCEIIDEQNCIGNTDFFNSPAPLELYIKINHQKE